MKKVALVLAFAMIAFSLAACANSTQPFPSQAQPPSQSAQAPSQSANPPVSTGAPSQSTPITNAGDFDHLPRPQIVPEGTKFRLGALTVNLSAESIVRVNHQLQIECAHRGWDYVPVFYETDANYNDAFTSLLNQGVHAIALINPIAAETHTDMYEAARKQGIGVYSIIGSISSGIITNFISAHGVMTMELLNRIGTDHNWKLNIAVLRMDAQPASSERMYPVIGYLEGKFRPEMNLVVTDDITGIYSTVGSTMLAGQEMARTWLEKYGDGIDAIMCYADNSAMGSAESIMAWGDKTGEKCFSVGIDGGKRSWSYIRDNTPLKYSYAMPMELFAHQLVELVIQIQIKGLNPGDPGCILEKSGRELFYSGKIITIDNVPAIGTSIHQPFNYYDVNVTGEAAWWNWTDGPGIYMVEAYVA